MRANELNYNLPKCLIAQYPVKPRDRARLMALNREEGKILHSIFYRLGDFLQQEDILVVNDSKVFPARLFGYKETQGKVQILLLRKLPMEGEVWECLVSRGKRLKEGDKIHFSPELMGEVRSNGSEGKKDISFEAHGNFWELIHRVGHVPLPPYIKREAKDEIDREGYQTIFARHEGAVAAPTAGLHFTPELKKKIEGKGVPIYTITLHVGIGSFRPIRADGEVKDHHLETEMYDIPFSSAEAINSARKKGGKVFAVGTTVVRALESAADESGTIHPKRGMTDLYIYPGYRFKVVDALITNFHLPRSTLLLLVFAFGGKEFVMKAYQEAIREGYQFYSYGDGMLIM